MRSPALKRFLADRKLVVVCVSAFIAIFTLYATVSQIGGATRLAAPELLQKYLSRAYRYPLTALYTEEAFESILRDGLLNLEPGRQSDTVDTFANYKNRDVCRISSLDIHVPFRPLCTDMESLLDAMSGGGRIGWDAPYQTRGCDMRWYSTQEACNIVSRFSHIMIAGDSLNRHVTNALWVILRSDLGYGGIREWDIHKLAEGPNPVIQKTENCRCRGQFWWSCSKIEIGDSEWLKGNSSHSLTCTDPLRITFNRLQQWPLQADVMEPFVSVFPKSLPDKPMALIMDHALWNDVNLTETGYYFDQVFDNITHRVPWLRQPENPMFKKLFLGPSVGGHLKAKNLMATQSINMLYRFEKGVKPLVQDRGFDFLGFYNMSVQTSSGDGTHPTMEVSLLKAQMVLNWLDNLNLDASEDETIKS